jgi:large subunit ribosomal protein L32
VILEFLVAFWVKIGILSSMVIRMRHTRAHTGNRRSHHALKAKTFAVCTNCEQPKETHIVCKNCGFYRGRKVVDVVKKAEKKQAKKK